jgi:hypothetical protein
MNLLDEQSACHEGVERLYPAERTDAMQRSAGEEGNPATAFNEGVIDRDERNQQKEKPLHDPADPDRARAEQANAFTEQSDHNEPPEILLSGV